MGDLVSYLKATTETATTDETATTETAKKETLKQRMGRGIKNIFKKSAPAIPGIDPKTVTAELSLFEKLFGPAERELPSDYASLAPLKLFRKIWEVKKNILTDPAGDGVKTLWEMVRHELHTGHAPEIINFLDQMLDIRKLYTEWSEETEDKVKDAKLTALKAKMDAVYDEYIKPDSNQMINIDGRLRNHIMSGLHDKKWMVDGSMISISGPEWEKSWQACEKENVNFIGQQTLLKLKLNGHLAGWIKKYVKEDEQSELIKPLSEIPDLVPEDELKPLSAVRDGTTTDGSSVWNMFDFENSHVNQDFSRLRLHSPRGTTMYKYNGWNGWNYNPNPNPNPTQLPDGLIMLLVIGLLIYFLLFCCSFVLGTKLKSWVIDSRRKMANRSRRYKAVADHRDDDDDDEIEI